MQRKFQDRYANQWLGNFQYLIKQLISNQKAHPYLTTTSLPFDF